LGETGKSLRLKQALSIDGIVNPGGLFADKFRFLFIFRFSPFHIMRVIRLKICKSEKVSWIRRGRE
jgi:hypothetical protein